MLALHLEPASYRGSDWEPGPFGGILFQGVFACLLTALLGFVPLGPDPKSGLQEFVDLATGDPDRSAVLENDLERIRREIRASRMTYEVDTQVDDELREQLEQLGYVER